MTEKRHPTRETSSSPDDSNGETSGASSPLALQDESLDAFNREIDEAFAVDPFFSDFDESLEGEPLSTSAAVDAPQERPTFEVPSIDMGQILGEVLPERPGPQASQEATVLVSRDALLAQEHAQNVAATAARSMAFEPLVRPDIAFRQAAAPPEPEPEPDLEPEPVVPTPDAGDDVEQTRVVPMSILGPEPDDEPEVQDSESASPAGADDPWAREETRQRRGPGKRGVKAPAPDADAELAVLAQEEASSNPEVVARGAQDPFEGTGIHVIEEVTGVTFIEESEQVGPTRQIEYRLGGLDGAAELPLPWPNFVGEMRREIVAQRDPLSRAAYLHEVADLLRFQGERWRQSAQMLDVLALDLAPNYLPALRARLVEALRGRPLGDRDVVLEETRVALENAEIQGGQAVTLLSALHCEVAIDAERRGHLEQARGAYEDAARMSMDPFFALNRVRFELVQDDVQGAAAAMMATADYAGEGSAASAMRAMWLADAGEMLRRAGRDQMAVRLMRQAVTHDPSHLAAWRALELIAWKANDPELEIEGITGQLAVLVEQGRQLDRRDPRMRVMKRRAASRFFRLGRLLWRVGRRADAMQSLKDALGIRRHELLFHRALERVARLAGDWRQVSEAITRQTGLIVDPVLQALLLVEQAHCFTMADDPIAARAALERSLELAPDCLPARIDLGRLLLREGAWEALLELRRSGPADEEPDPNLAQAHRKACDAWRRGEILEFELEDLGKATDEYALACRWDPSSGPWLRAAERLLMHAGRWDDLDAFWKLVIENTTSPSRRRAALLKVARLADERGDLKSAIAHFLKLLDADEVALDRLEELGHLYRRSGWPEAAAQVLEQVVEMSVAALEEAEDDSAAHHEASWAIARCMRWLAHIYEHDLDELDKATESHRRLLELRPGDPAALERFRKTLVRQGKWAALVELLATQAVQTQNAAQKRSLLLEAAELCQRRLRDRQRALAILRDASVLFPEDVTVQDAFEEALRQRSEWVELANVLLARAQREGGQDMHQGARLAVEAGLLYRDRLGDVANARKAFVLALEIAPRLTLALKALADVLAVEEAFVPLVAHLARWREGAEAEQTWLTLAAEEAWLREFRLDQPQEALDLHFEVLGRAPERIDSLLAVVRLQARLDNGPALVTALRELATRVEDVQDAAALWDRAARLAERLGLDAEPDYRRALELSPDHEGARCGLERVLRAKGENGDLLVFYLDQARRTRGIEQLHALMRIASVYENMDRASDAREILLRILKVAPEFDLARLTLARLARQDKGWEEAARLECELAESAPSQELMVEHLRNAANIYQHHLNDTARAEPLLRQILSLDPMADGVYESLRKFYGEHQKPDQIEGLLEIIDGRLTQTTGGARLSLLREGARVAGERRPERARGYLSQIMEMNPNDGPAMLFSANLAETIGEVDEAVSLIRRWLEMDAEQGGMGEPNEDELAFRHGILLRISTLLVDKLRSFVEAEPYLEELLQAQPRHPIGCSLMARAQLGLRRPDRASSLYKDIFEVQPSATLALQIAWLLDDDLNRKQEALSWYMRAQDLDPLSPEAMKGFFGVMRHLEAIAPATVRVRVLRDRLEWLVESFHQAIDEEPWQLDHFRQLARVHALRQDHQSLRDVAGVLVYFGAADPVIHEAYLAHKPGQPGRLLGNEVQPLADEDVRSTILLKGAQGLRRRVFSLAWESIATVDPDDLRRRGLSRGNRFTGRDSSSRLARIVSLARNLHIFGVDIYPHPTDPYAVLSLFTPEPSLVVGSAIFEKPNDPFHHFRVARALESLRDGKGLMARRDVMPMLGALDEVMDGLFAGNSSLPVFGGVGSGSGWLSDGSKRLMREIKRRSRRDLRSVLDSSDRRDLNGSVDDWITSCKRSPLRLGMAVCGEFGAAIDAIAGTSFSLEPGGSRPGRQEAMIDQLRGGSYRQDVEDMLRFIVSEDYGTLRRRLGVV